MKYFLALQSFAFAAALSSSPASAQTFTTLLPALPQVGYSIIKTSKVAVAERLLLPDGSLGKEIDTNFSAFLIKHKNDHMLFDTCLGRNIEAQYAQDMPYWQRPFFKFDKPVLLARKQLDASDLAACGIQRLCAKPGPVQ